ncbi:uncharacterized protein DUF1524 [Prauserella shujinwangii]|uniref:Uncharacterized protein DUF1524 n=1 Tax=Prauserella shujinwangii TaxID=1453103 RepID=A0A2T0LK36_9PSEU|nr:HNH endonuclease family protein [Prauserella shujinwangii]PRX43048.1 uncharacterized protein DUF1524 [Prauserella shujinwangii]
MHTHTTTRHTLLAGLAAAALATSGCELPDLDTLAPGAPSAPATGTPRELPALAVAAEDTGAHYDRDDWPHWTSLGDGCDVRDAVLQAQGQGVRTGSDCAVSGRWVSVYDGATVTDSSELDIDHLVPLAEAARSGARHWTQAQRERFANDPAGLVAVTATSNRQKGDQDPAEWLPHRDRCGYIARWVDIKHTYGLTADPAEAAAIRAAWARCPR